MPGLFRQVRRAVQEVQPDVLHCWMYHANLLGLAALGSGARILWSVHSASPWAINKQMTRWVSTACARLSGLVPDRIVYVAEAARRAHEAAGYAAARGLVIPNGIDMERFRLPAAPRPQGGRLRLGVVARYDPVKGHHFLIDVLARHPLRDRIELVLAGQGCDTAPALREHLAQVGLLERTELHGAVAAVETLYASLDILALPSRSEALPMAVLEAAATGLTVCASRVGDVPRIGLPEETLFAPCDAADCARALGAAISRCAQPNERDAQRALVLDRFDVTTAAARYAALYRAVTAAPGTSP